MYAYMPIKETKSTCRGMLRVLGSPGNSRTNELSHLRSSRFNLTSSGPKLCFFNSSEMDSTDGDSMEEPERTPQNGEGLGRDVWMLEGWKWKLARDLERRGRREGGDLGKKGRKRRAVEEREGEE